MIERVIGLSSGPAGGDGQTIIFCELIKNAWVNQQFFSMDKTFIMVKPGGDTIGGFKKSLSQIDFLKNMLDNVTTADITRIQPIDKRIFGFACSLKQDRQRFLG